MSIVRMNRLRVIAVRDQRDALMLALQRFGCVEVHEPEELLSDEETAAALQPERAQLAERRTALASMQAAVRVLGQYAPEKKKLLSARPAVKEADFLDEDALGADAVLAGQINERESRIRRLSAEIARVSADREALSPWEALEEPLTGAGTKTCGIALFSAAAQIDMTSVLAAAEGASEAVEIVLVSEDEQQHCFLAIALKKELDRIADALRGIGCTQVAFPGLEGTAKENIERLGQELEALTQERDALRGELAALGGKTASLRLSCDRLAAEAARAEATERLVGTGSVVILEGWIPAEQTSRLGELLAAFDCAWETREPTEDEVPQVPVSLKNSRIVKPMNLVTEMYSLPAYDGIDPNPYMWPFFVLFYGIMMADMGYGILMCLVSLIALKKMRPKDGGTKYLLSLAGLCGVATFLFGALTGGFFGDLIPQMAAIIDPDTTLTALPSLFTPLNDTMMILIGSLALGVVQIFTGMIISVVHKCRTGQALSALFEEGAWWCILFGAVLMILKLGPWLLIAGGVLLTVGQFVTKKSIVGGLTGLFGAVYNGVTGYFSDILSYSRLMALMLAGSVIAMVFNTLGAMTGSAVAFLIVAMIGNALNFALNLLGCFVHDLRLQVLEFFSRFYQDGGRPFRPLHIDPQNVEMIKEET